MKQEECCICYSDNTNVKLHCNHHFHKECIVAWYNTTSSIKRNCCYCTQPITLDEYTLLDLKVTGSIDLFAKEGNLEMVKHFHSLKGECTTNAMDYAAKHGHLEIVKYLHLNRKEGCTTSAMNDAAKNGH